MKLICLQLCYKVEADNRTFLNAMEQSRLEFKRLMIVTVNTDALYAYWDLNATELCWAQEKIVDRYLFNSMQSC